MLRLELVWLVCSLCAVFETTVGEPADAIHGCEREINQTLEAEHCKNKIHPGAGLSCCGERAYNPAVATCCKKEHELNVTANVTCGLSETVSACCGLRAYSPVNEICCTSTVVTKPVAFAQCCGREAYDERKELCCGPLGNRTVQKRNSSDHQCCGHEQFNTTSECCCSTNVSLTVHKKDEECCKTELATCRNKTDTYNTELCQSTVVKKNSSNSQCCGKEAYDEHEQLCCGPLDNRTVLDRESEHHQCCGLKQFNTTSQCCCFKNGSLEILPKYPKCCLGETAVCGTKAFDKHAELCCQSTVVKKNSSNSQCCGKEAYDEHEQLCCGPLDNRTVLDRKSRFHQCCGLKQFDTKTNCCCVTHGSLDVHPRDHKCCVEESGVLPPPPGPQRTCTDPEKIICGSSCYNPKEFCCCDKKRSNQCCTTGQCDAAVNNPKTDVCCDGHVRNQHHGSRGHCCGTELYYPHNETCCDGRRYREKNVHCCGAKAYHIKTRHMKCCAGTLYNETQFRCCGSILQKEQDICCSNEDKNVLWSFKDGFKCCGHLYYNTSLWDCCAGMLIPVQQPGHKQTNTTDEQRLQSLNDLSEQELCKELKVRTVESVSPLRIVFSSILKLCGKTGHAKFLPSPEILNTSDHCNFPTLIPGKTYFFIGSNIFTDPNHDSILQSIHYIFCKCSKC